MPLFLKGNHPYFFCCFEFLCYEKIANLMYNINTNSVATNIFNLFSKLPVFILTLHAHQHLEIILPRNPYLVFKVRPFHMLALKSGMEYQLVSKMCPRTLLKNH